MAGTTCFLIIFCNKPLEARHIDKYGNGRLEIVCTYNKWPKNYISILAGDHITHPPRLFFCWKPSTLLMHSQRQLSLFVSLCLTRPIVPMHLRSLLSLPSTSSNHILGRWNLPQLHWCLPRIPSCIAVWMCLSRASRTGLSRDDSADGPFPL